MKAIWNNQILAESEDTIVVGSEENKDAAWYYPSPKEAAKEITGRVAFSRGVEVTD